MILAGDLGGTKSNLAFYELRAGRVHRLEQRRYPSGDYKRVEEILEDFARPALGKIKAACFGVAGPVIAGRVRFTNLPWEFDAESLARLLRVPRVVLVNDMESTAHGLDVTPSDNIVTLVEGEPVEGGNQALIAAGTGLGEALWSWHTGRRVVVTTEGGHADFGARNEQEIEFLRFMQKKYARVSYELILSGDGIRDLHDFFGPGVRHPAFDDDEDDAAAITANAVAGKCPTCVAALDQWVTIYGAEAGNLALKSLAVGGVYVAGGIAAKILDYLKRGGFARAFREKSKFEYLLARIPIRVLLDEEAPLDGAAVRAAMELNA